MFNVKCLMFNWAAPLRNSAMSMGKGMMQSLPLSPRTARKAEGFWRERKQEAALRGTTAAAERPKESPTLSSRAEVEAVLSRLFSLWLAPSSLGLFWRGLRLWLHLLLHWGSRGCSFCACNLLRQACEAII